ncbi:MAG: hypothetical protein O7C75_00120 [Verrucomicrobia bacterium]|nr:hypothetical protein [Verrucomicrobiota bacterium]
MPVKIRENLRHGDKTLVIDGSPISVEEHWDHRLYQFTINPYAYKSTASIQIARPKRLQPMDAHSHCLTDFLSGNLLPEYVGSNEMKTA